MRCQPSLAPERLRGSRSGAVGHVPATRWKPAEADRLSPDARGPRTMTERLEAVVPDELRRKLLEELDAPDAFTMLVITDDGSWPHLAMVSRGEVVYGGERQLGLALWPESTACRNLTARGRAVLAFVLGGIAYTLRMAAVRLSDLSLAPNPPLACFRLSVEGVTGDRPPYAVLESGVRFSLVEPGVTIPKWRATRRALLAAVGPAMGSSA
jgi:hypothetical protein